MHSSLPSHVIIFQDYIDKGYGFMLIKIIPSLLCLSLFLPAYEVDIKFIKKQFHKDVLIQNIYNKRFSKEIKKVCKLSDSLCYQKTIAALQKEYSLLEDRKLQKLYSKQVISKIPSLEYIKRLQSYLLTYNSYFDSSQFITFIDLSKQMIFILLFEKEKQTFHFIGGDLISAGDINREKEVILGEDHFLKTPTGIFDIKSGWRSDGEILSDGYTLPYGQNNRYVFYFGQQESIRYNTFDRNGTKLDDESSWTLIKDELSFALHAHQSSSFRGKPYSHGCVRTSNEFNAFLDNYHILHAKAIDGKDWISRSTPPNDPRYHNFAGRYLIVVDKLPR